MTDAELKDLILGLLGDALLDFIVYDRKDCEQLRRGQIEDAVKRGVVSVDELVQTFKTHMEDHLS